MHQRSALRAGDPPRVAAYRWRVRPSTVIAYLYVTNGRPVTTVLRSPSFCRFIRRPSVPLCQIDRHAGLAQNVSIPDRSPPEWDRSRPPPPERTRRRQRRSARRGTSVRAAGLQSHVQVVPAHTARAMSESSGASSAAVPAPRAAYRVLDRHDLGVVAPRTHVVTLAQNPAVADDDRAHHGVGAACNPALLRQRERPLEHEDVVCVQPQQKTPRASWPRGR